MLHLIQNNQVIALFIYMCSTSIFYFIEVLHKIESISQTDSYYSDIVDK